MSSVPSLPSKGQCVAQADDGRQPERARQDGDVRGGGARLGGNGRDAVAIELQRERRREIVRDENGVRAGRHIDWVMIGEIEQHGEHADVHVHEIADFLAQHRRRVPRETLPPFQQNEIEGLLRPEILANQGFGTAREFAVVEDGDLHIEDRRFLGSHLLLRARTQLTQAIAGAVEGNVQPDDFRIDGLISDEAMTHFWHLPAQEVHGSDDDAR